MGVVYEAEDLTLGRRVALKFLPPEVSGESAVLERFMLEARAASALNHPNICTIYAVENAGDKSFIAMELLEGQALDEVLVSGPLPFDRMLEISIQLSDALEAAHAKGIVHRDIKPANIFITQRGTVKILDFGLAKLTQFAQATAETVASLGPSAAHLTSPGSTVGTIAYMSPEQARGETLDSRSDLFSLGTVIYQMATGRLPFEGKTSAVIFHAILERNPTPPTSINSALPLKLQEIIERALEKDRDLRYQSAADLRGDLRRLKRDAASGHTAAASSSGTGISVSSTGYNAPRSSRAISAARRHKIGAGLTTLIAIALLGAAGYGVFALLSRSRPVPFQTISVRKITETGKAALAAISPDGKYILNVVDDSGQESLWLRNVPTASDTQVIPPSKVHYTGLRFSPDGNYLYFVRSEQGSQELEYLYRAPVLGGTPQRLAADVDSNITFSPDGARFAFLRYNDPDPNKYQIISQSTESGEAKVIAGGPTTQCLFGLTWSPDGKVLVCVYLQPEGALTGLVAIDVSTGQQKIFASSKGLLDKPTWLPDGRNLLVLDRDFSSGFVRHGIGLISYPGGNFRPVTSDINDYSDLSVDADGHELAAVFNESHWDLYLMPASATGSAQATKITSGEPVTSFDWMPNGQIVVTSDLLLNIINPDTGAKTMFPVEENAAEAQPSACSNGRYVVFVLAGHGGQGREVIGRVDAGGGNLKVLTNGKVDEEPVCSPDGNWVFYRDTANGATLMRVSIEGGASRKIYGLPVARAFDISPDGKMAVFPTFQHVGEHTDKLALVPLEANDSPKLLDFQRPLVGNVRFTRDGRSVVYPIRDHGIDNLWQQPLDGSPGKQITNFTSEHIGDSFGWSPDGSKLAIIRGHVDSDVALIRNGK